MIEKDSNKLYGVLAFGRHAALLNDCCLAFLDKYGLIRFATCSEMVDYYAEQ